MRKLIIIFVLVGLLVSCSATKLSDYDIHKIGIPFNKLNTEIKLNLIGSLNSYKIGDAVNFEVVNLIDKPIQVVPDKNIVIYQKIQNKYIEIANNVNYSSAVKLIPTKQEDLFGMGSLLFDAYPNVQKPYEATSVRIFVTGIICNSDGTPTGEQVGGYVDVNLHP